MKMPDNLRRVAIVTGAARGIGAAAACRLARDGMAVAALDLEAGACGATVAAITADGGQAMAVGADVSRADQVEAAVSTVAADLGPPTVLASSETTCCSRCQVRTGTPSSACTCAARS